MIEYGFVRLAAATPQIRVADVSGNTAAVLNLIREAEAHGAAAVVFPELCLTGYTAGDLLLQRRLREAVLAGLKSLLDNTKQFDTLAVVGLPLEKDGALYNCAAVLQRGKILGIVPKTHLPNYSEFWELRYFAPAPAENGVIRLFGEDVPFGTKLLFAAREQPDFVLAVELCEDLWVPAPPSISHALAGATVIANLSASDEMAAKDDYRRLLLSSQSARLTCAYVYADAGEGESSTDLVFAGHNIIAENGALLAESKLFETGILYADADVDKLAQERLRMNTFPPDINGGYLRIPFDKLKDTALARTFSRYPFVPEEEEYRANRCAKLLNLQARGLASRMRHIHCEKLVLGLSGGLDSTLALLVAVRAMEILEKPKRDILALTMPCFGTTKRTRSNAEKLAECLGVSFACVDITKSVTQHLADLGIDRSDRSVAFENAQARERTQVLMDVANRDGSLVVGTGDLSELALGFATYNGDHMSMYGVNASVPKTLVRHIVRRAAEDAPDTALKSVLLDVLDTPVSPELLPPEEGDQHTEDIVGPYELHDFFLYYLLRYGFTPAKILYLARLTFIDYAPEVIEKWWNIFARRFFSSQFKRSCLPDGPKVGSVSLSPRGDWKMPSDAAGMLWQEQGKG